MAAFLDSDSSDGEDFEGFVVSPEEKVSYKEWTRKRRASDAFEGNSDSEENVSEDDDDDDDDDEEDDDGDYESAEEEEEEHEDDGNDEMDETLDDIHLQDSGDEASSSHTDQCPVCLMSLKEQMLGTPNNCPHVFCFECIQEWAKNATTCPVGRKPFSEILVHATRKGPILQRIPVEERKASDDEVEEDPTYCEVCGDFDREDRMLLCDGCDHGYHMECLTPPVAYVPVEEWFCPACSSQTEPHEDREGLAEEGHGESLGLREVPRARTTRGRPRGSTARRVSVLGRTDTTRRARTVASTRGRGRTRRGRGRGRGRGRSSSRGRGRGGRGSSTRTRTSSTTTGRKKKRRKRRKRSKKTTGTTSTKRRKKITKTKTLKRRRVMIAEEDEVSPFIYEPRRRGRTVHARLLESLNSPGPTVEPGRSPSLGRMPFPSRVEPSASFSLFGNTYALHDFVDKEDDTRETSQTEDKTKAWSSESTDPDVLGSIFQGLDSLHTSSAQVARDGKILATDDQSRAKGSSSSNAKGSKDTLTVNEDETKLKTDLEIKQRTAEKGKCLAESDKISKEPDITKHPSKVKGNSDEECPPENIFEKLSSSKTTELHKNTSSSASSSFKSTSPSPSSNPLSSKSTLSGFRIPKRCSKSQDESNQTSPSSSSSSINVKQEPSPNSCIANFKIPKRTKSMSCESSSADVTKPTHVKCMGQKLTTSLNSGVEQKLLFSNFTSPSKSITHSSCAAESVGSSLSQLSSVRPHMQENLQRRNSLNSSSTASVTNSSSVTGCHTISGYTTTAAAGPCVTNSSSVTRSIAKNITGVTHSHTTTANTAAPGVTNSRSSTTCHAKKVSDMPCSHTRTSNALTPFTKVAPLIDHLKPVVGKEQRRSNIEIIKMLHEKKRCMREEMSGDGKGSSSARPGHSGVTDASALPRKGIHVSEKSPTCSRPGHSGVTDATALPRKGIHVSEKSPTCSRPGHSGVTDATALPRKGIHVSDKSPTCSRPGHSGVTNATALPRKEIHVSDKSPACSRPVHGGVTDASALPRKGIHVSDKSPALPVAIVKPSPQIPSVTVNESSLLPCNSLENSPVKSIASGIITAHSHNTREFKRVRSESDPQKTVGINPSGPHTEHEAATRKHDGMVTGATDDRDQQRKLGIVRVQRHEQIVDEVKLALKPFFKQGEITKDDYKLIMRKSVEKIKESSSSVDRDRVCRLVKKYIKKIKGVSP